MRNVLGLSAVLLMCMALSSCSGNRPEKAFMGTWESTAGGGATIELSFMEKEVLIIKMPAKPMTGTWTIDPEGNAVMTLRDKKSIATFVNDGKIVVLEEGASWALVFEKSDSKKK